MASSKLLEFNTPEEAEEVEEIFNNAIQCLSEEDRALGPVTRMLPMLKKVWKKSSPIIISRVIPLVETRNSSVSTML